MSSNKMKILSLYRQMLRTSKKFSNYNFRTYAVRRTKDGFHAGKSETDPQNIQSLIQKAEESLELLTRQTLISQLYKEPLQVIESQQSTKK